MAKKLRLSADLQQAFWRLILNGNPVYVQYANSDRTAPAGFNDR